MGWDVMRLNEKRTSVTSTFSSSSSSSSSLPSLSSSASFSHLTKGAALAWISLASSLETYFLETWWKKTKTSLIQLRLNTDDQVSSTQKWRWCVATQASTHTHLLCPGKYDVFLQQVRIVQVFEDDGNARQQLDLMQLHDALKTSQQILLGLLVVVAELKIRKTVMRWYRKKV